MTVFEMLKYPFIVRAIVVGTAVALCAALLGVSLVLKNYSMMGDGLSHVGFGALAVAVPLNVAPLTLALPVVTAAAFLLLHLKDDGRLKGDGALALLSTGSLAFGVLVLSMTTGMNTDVCNYLFGTILSMSHTDVRLSLILSVLVVTVFVLCYNRIFSITFDEEFAQAAGLNVKFYNTLIAVLTSMVIVLGMRLMGALLISGLIVIPAVSAMILCKRFRMVTLMAALISLVCFNVGIYCSYRWATPAGAGIVACNFIVLFGAKIYDVIKVGE